MAIEVSTSKDIRYKPNESARIKILKDYAFLEKKRGRITLQQLLNEAVLQFKAN